MLIRRFTIFVLLIAASAAAASFPPINYHHRTLANGLEVYSIEDHATPTVAINVWYRVGSKNDPEGRSGFAHLFEHIMFKATAHMKSEMLDRLTEDVGGMNNAYTHPDRTVYYEVIPSNYLQTLLWAEGERMGSLTVDEANFKSERDVVKEEYRFRVLAPSYGRFNNALTRDSYAVHPYKRPGIGSIENLDASTLADVQAFHSTYYRPDNAVLIVAGDFDPKQFDTWLDRYLGTIPKPSTEIPRVIVKEPARTEEKHFTEHGANVPLPAVGLTWLIPPAQSDDTEALQVASTILSEGESSRLYQSLVYKKQLAQSANANADTREDTGLFTVTAVMAGGKKPEDGIVALRQEIDALGAKPVGAAELEKAKNLIITGALRERETNDGKAGALGEAITQFHDASYVNRGLERLQAVTAADVQRVMKKYLIDGKAVVVTYTQEKGVGEMKTTLLTAAALTLALHPAIAQVETTPPPPAAPRQLQIPKPVEKTLSNGLRVIVIEKKGVPLVAARLLIKNGGEADPANLPGLADTTASLLTKGTTTKSAEEIARGIEALGATLDTGAGWDESSADVSVMSSKLPQALGFLADVVRHPTFKQEEIDRLRQQNVDALSVAMKQPGRLASFVMAHAIFGNSAYGHFLGGTPESLTRIKREDIVAFHRNYYRPDNAILVLGGDIAPAKAFAAAQELFGAWKPAANSHLVEPAAAKEFPSPHMIVIDMPAAGQAAVVAGRPGLRRADPSYYLSLVTNSILGGGYSSRLNEEIRVKRGLTYGANSSFDLRRDVGPFTATVQTKNESAGEVAGLVVDELNKLGMTPVEDAELGPRKAVLIGGFGRQLETNSGIVGRIGTLALYGLSLNEINRYISGVQAITAADIQKFAATHLGGNDASLVIVGDAKKFLPVVQQRFKNIEVIPIDELDVNSPTLRKSK